MHDAYPVHRVAALFFTQVHWLLKFNKATFTEIFHYCAQIGVKVIEIGFYWPILFLEPRLPD